MVKEDAVTKKKNKARRKRMQNEGSNVSAHVTFIIASKSSGCLENARCYM